MKLTLSTVFGLLVGVSGTFLHNSYRPIGVIISLFALYLGLRLVTNMYQSKFYQLTFAAGWVFVVVRGSTLGNGGEVLIEANLYGNLFVFGGIALTVVQLLRRIKF